MEVKCNRSLLSELVSIGLTDNQIYKVLEWTETLPIHIMDNILNTKVSILKGFVLVEQNIISHTNLCPIKESNIESTQINVPGLPNTDIKWIEVIKQSTKESYEGNLKNKFIFDEQVLFPTDPLKQETYHIVIDPVFPNPTFSVINTSK